MTDFSSSCSNIEQIRKIVDWILGEESNSEEINNILENLENIIDQIDPNDFEIFVKSLSPEFISNAILRITENKSLFFFFSKILCIFSSDEESCSTCLSDFDFSTIFAYFTEYINKYDNENDDLVNRIYITVGNFLLFEQLNGADIAALQTGLISSLVNYETNNPLILETKAWFISILFSINNTSFHEGLLEACWPLATNQNDEISYRGLKSLFNASLNDDSIRHFLFEQKSFLFSTSTNDNWKLRKITMKIFESLFENYKDQLQTDENFLNALFDCISIDRGKAASHALMMIEKTINESIYYDKLANSEFLSIIMASDVIFKSSFIRFLARISCNYKISILFSIENQLFNVLDDFLDSSDSLDIYSSIIILWKLKQENETELGDHIDSFLDEKKEEIFSLVDEYQIPSELSQHEDKIQEFII